MNETIYDLKFKTDCIVATKICKIDEILLLNSGDIIDINLKIGDKSKIFINDNFISDCKISIKNNRLKAKIF